MTNVQLLTVSQTLRSGETFIAEEINDELQRARELGLIRYKKLAAKKAKPEPVVEPASDMCTVCGAGPFKNVMQHARANGDDEHMALLKEA